MSAGEALDQSRHDQRLTFDSPNQFMPSELVDVHTEAPYIGSIVGVPPVSVMLISASRSSRHNSHQSAFTCAPSGLTYGKVERTNRLEG